MRLTLLSALCAAAILHSNACLADNSDIDGVWLIEERLSPFDEAVASVPLVGFLWRQTTGQADHLILSDDNGRLVIHIPQRQVRFTETTRSGNEIIGRTTGPYVSGQQGLQTADVRIRVDAGILTGEYSHANVRVFWRGKQSTEVVRDRNLLREAQAALRLAQGRISELESSMRSVASSPARQAIAEAETTRMLSERLAASDQLRGQLEREIQQLRDTLARTQAAPRTAASGGPARRASPTPNNVAPPPTEETSRPISDSVAAVPIAPIASEPLDARRSKGFIRVDGPQIGEAIAAPAVGFMSLVGQVEQLRLPLRKFTVDGQPTTVAPSGEFHSVVTITLDTKAISFEAVDRDGQVHKLMLPIVIRPSIGG